MTVRIAPLTHDDIDDLVSAVSESRDLLGPWLSHSTDPAVWRSRIDGLGERHLSFLIHRELGPHEVLVGHGLVGMVNANEIVRGLFHSAYLGYNAFAPFAGQGLFRTGMAMVLDHLFAEADGGGVGLHRAEANIQPPNQRSIGVVTALGFRQEGYSPDYLFIDGAWRDHERWAITAPEWHARRAGTPEV